MTSDSELWRELIVELPGAFLHWPVSMSLLGLAAALIAARLARGRHWGWYGAVVLIVAGILVIPWIAMLDAGEYNDDEYESDYEECVCPTTAGCGVPAALEPMPGWVEVGRCPASRRLST